MSLQSLSTGSMYSAHQHVAPLMFIALMLLVVPLPSKAAWFSSLLPRQAPAALERIVLGSCNNQKEHKKTLWKPILDEKPDLFVWLGDIVYADPSFFIMRWPATPKQIQDAYKALGKQAGYKQLAKTVPIKGIWDDHDMGENDGGRLYKHRDASKQIMLEFLREPRGSPRWSQTDGSYAAYDFGPVEKSVKLILLDTRYNQDHAAQQLLGEGQWRWLEQQLWNNTAKLTIIGSSIQFANTKGPSSENWQRFPHERRRLLDLLTRSSLHSGTAVVITSGDVHLAEVANTHYCIPDPRGAGAQPGAPPPTHPSDLTDHQPTSPPASESSQPGSTSAESNEPAPLLPQSPDSAASAPGEPAPEFKPDLTHAEPAAHIAAALRWPSDGDAPLPPTPTPTPTPTPAASHSCGSTHEPLTMDSLRSAMLPFLPTRPKRLPDPLLTGQTPPLDLATTPLVCLRVFDFTTSGMTHSVKNHIPLPYLQEMVRFAMSLSDPMPASDPSHSGLYLDRNYGVLDIDWEASPPRLAIVAKAHDGSVPIMVNLTFDQIRPVQVRSLSEVPPAFWYELRGRGSSKKSWFGTTWLKLLVLAIMATGTSIAALLLHLLLGVLQRELKSRRYRVGAPTLAMTEIAN